MAFSGQVLDNPISGERFVFRQTAGETDGRLLAFDLVLAPNGHVPGGHVHPEQEERFHVLAGTVRFRTGLRRILATAGDELVVPPGTYHRFANAGDDAAVVRVQVQPALSMEQLYETVVALARDGRTTRTGMPKPLDLALFMREFEREVQAPLAGELVRAATAPLAWLAARRGLTRRYPRLLAASPLGPVCPGSGRPAARPGPTRPSPATRKAPAGHPGGTRRPCGFPNCGRPTTCASSASSSGSYPGVGHRHVGVAVVQVEGEPVLDLDHAFDIVDGADQVRDETAPLGPALQDDDPVVDLDEEAAWGHHELGDDDVVQDLALDGLVGPG
jgi:quercetin dioxygenase-like cupin family protein